MMARGSAFTIPPCWRAAWIIAFMTLVGAVAQPAAQNDATIERLFASAEHKATIEGNPKGAIAEYERILSLSAGQPAIAVRG